MFYWPKRTKLTKSCFGRTSKILNRQIREVKRIDIANDPIPSGDPNVPGRTQITKADPPIGPLSGNWRETVTPVMTVYKLVSE